VELIPRSEFERAPKDLALLGDMCRLNTLVAVKRAGSGHLGSSFSAMDIVVHLFFQELAKLEGEPPKRSPGFWSKLKEALGKDVNYFFNVDPISIWLANPTALKPELVPLIKMVGDEYEKARPGTVVKSAHVGMAASNTYVFMTEVLPRAIKKYGGVDADALRKAALEVDLPEGGTMLGFGVKFAGAGSPIAGQNERAFPVIVQYIDDKVSVVWPKSLQHREPVLPLPGTSPYSAN